MPNVYLLSDDLMTTSRIQGASDARVNVVSAMSVDTLLKQLSNEAGESRPLIIVDLQARGIEWSEDLRELTKIGRVLAFGPHVWKEQLDLARDAGCDHVLTNGEFYSQIGRWLSAPSEM